MKHRDQRWYCVQENLRWSMWWLEISRGKFRTTDTDKEGIYLGPGVDIIALLSMEKFSSLVDTRAGQMAICRPFSVGNKYESLTTSRRISTSSPASQPQPYQGAGLHKIEATVREVKNSMLTNPPFMGIKRTVYWCWSQPCMISGVYAWFSSQNYRKHGILDFPLLWPQYNLAEPSALFRMMLLGK